MLDQVKGTSHKGLCDAIYMKCPEDANLERQTVDEWLPRAETARRACRGHQFNERDSFGANKNVLSLSDHRTAL